jgi:chemotaxis protein MotB
MTHLASEPRRSPGRVAPWSLALAGLLTGCGYTEEEWKLQLDKYARVVSESQRWREMGSQATKDLESERTRSGRYASVLELAGIDPKGVDEAAERKSGMEQLSAELELRDYALNELRDRLAKQDEAATKALWLRKELAPLAEGGVAVGLLAGKLTVVLPPPRTFSGDTLKKEGKDALTLFAKSVKAEPSLAVRRFEVRVAVAGKDPKAALGSALARAREVVAFLVSDKSTGLDATRWSGVGQAVAPPPPPPKGSKAKPASADRVELVMLD